MTGKKSPHRPSNNPGSKKGNVSPGPSSLPVGFKKFSTPAAILAIVALGIVVYSNSFQCAFQFDDFNNIVDNIKIRNLTDIKAWWNFYPTRPVGVFTFALNYQFDGYNPTYYHLVNLVIHLVNALLVWKLVVLIFTAPLMREHTLFKYRKSIALFTALLFVSHPLATQSVTYIVQRMASLAALFYLASLALYVKGRLTGSQGVYRYTLFCGAIVCAILAMLTKENAFTLPFGVLLFELCFLQGRFPRINFRDYRVIAGIIAFACIISIIPLMLSFKVFNPIPPSLGHTYTVTPGGYLMTQFRVIFTYTRLLLLPVNQMLDYDYPISSTLFEIKTLSGLLFIIGLLASGLLLFKKYRLLSFGIFWFLLTLSVESGIIPISDLIFEHRTYLPSFGFFLCMAAGLYYVIPGKRAYMATAILLTIILINSFLTYERNRVWKDELTLWTDNVAKAPGKSRPYVNLGKARSHSGDIAGGLEAYEMAIKLNPGYSEAWFNRGISKGILKDYPGAIADYSKALSIEPKYEKALINRGSVKMLINDDKGAIEDFLLALRISPNSPTTLYNCALSYQKLNDVPNAARYYSQAIRYQPENPQPFFQRGVLHFNSGQFDKAIEDFSSVIRLQPQSSEACYFRGKAYVQLRKYTEAIASFSLAISLNPGYYDACFEKALTEFALENYAAAIDDFTQALRLNPQSGIAYSNRGSARYKSNDKIGACLDWKTAAELGMEDARKYLLIFCR